MSVCTARSGQLVELLATDIWMNQANDRLGDRTKFDLFENMKMEIGEFRGK